MGTQVSQLSTYFTKNSSLVLLMKSCFRAILQVSSYHYQLKKTARIVKKIEKDKTARLISDTGRKVKATAASSYWKVDYPMQYLGPGYRDYLYKKIKGER